MRTAMRLIAVGVATVSFGSIAQASTIAGGADHSIAIKDDGSVWTWGDNGNGELGVDTGGADSLIPVQVTALSGTTIVAVAAGQNFSVALDAFGYVYAWGANSAGQLGDGTTTGQPLPQQVPGLSGITMIAAGQQFVLAQANNGELWAWGANLSGQLGYNNTTQQNSPVHVKNAAGTGNLSGVTRITAGAFHSLAVTSDNKVWAWGKQTNGQLGNGVASSSPQTLPVQVLGGAAGGTNLADISEIAGGSGSSYAVRTDGNLYSWGLNDNGQLGNNDSALAQKTTPVQVKSTSGGGFLTNIAGVAAGDLHALAVSNTGALYSWGRNVDGQGGINSQISPKLRPTVVNLINVVAIAGGTSFSLAVKSGTPGTAYGWGINGSGQVGDNSILTRTVPTAVSGSGFVWMAKTPTFNPVAGTYYANQNVAITSTTPNSTIRYTIGTNPLDPDTNSTVLLPGQTVPVTQSTTIKAKAWSGTLAPSNVGQAVYTMKVATPVLTPGSGGPYGAPISVSMSTTTSGASVYYTADGTEPTTASSVPPASVATATTLKAKGFKTGWTDSDTATASYTFNFGTLAAPGISPAGGSYVSSASVTLSSIAGATIRYTMDGSEPTDTSAPYTGPINVDVSMTVKAKAWHPDWSPSTSSQQTYTIQVATPVVTPDGGTFDNPQTVSVTTTTAGATVRYTTNGVDPTTSDAAVTGGTVFVDHTLTLKTRAFKIGATPSNVKTSDFTINRPLIFGGFDNSRVVLPAATVWGWGPNDNGQLGDGTNTYAGQPKVGPGWTNVKAVGVGWKHTLYLRSDGTLWAAGANDFSQLGIGAATGDQRTPVQVMHDALTPMTNVVAVAAGNSFSLAVKADGTLWAWGKNANGQIGNGTQTTALYPVQVLTGARSVGAGTSSSYAVDNLGHVWAWGSNLWGQLGDGSKVDRWAPVQVNGLTNIVSVSAGSDFALALRDDGAVWAWGDNGVYQLGDGTSQGRTIPIRVPGLTSMIAIAAGAGRHSVALRADGTVWTWGNNPSGQLGYETTSPPPGAKSVPGLSGVTAIGAGENHSLALTSAHSVWAWGINNGLRQVGDGAIYNDRRTPVLVFDPGFVPKAATPTYSPQSSQTWTSPLAITISGLQGTEIHYTTNGNDPTQADPTAAYTGTQVSLTGTSTLKTKSWPINDPSRNASNVGAETYTFRLPSPSFNYPTGTYTPPLSLTMTLINPPSGCTIWYTTDGSEPAPGGATSTQYTTPISITQTKTYRARTFKTGWTDSDPTQATYTINNGTISTPIASPGAGSYSGARSVALSTTTPTDALIYYTLDGTDPTQSSSPYLGLINVDRTLTLKAKAWKVDWTESGILTAAYTITYSKTCATPTISPASTSSNVALSATLTCSTTSSNIRYTTNNTTPQYNSTLYTGPITVDQTMTLRAKCFRAGWNDSAEPSPATYTLNLLAPTFNPSGGAAPQNVTVTQTTPGAVIRYTLDNTEPDLPDAIVASGGTVLVDATRTLKAKAWKTGWTTSTTASATYTLSAGTAAAPYFWPDAGSYTSAQKVVIASTTPDATIRYTTDGTDPGPLSPVFTQGVLLGATTTLKAKTFKLGMTASATATAVYTINSPTVALPTFSPAPGSYPAKRTVVVTSATSGAEIHYTTNGADPTPSDPLVPVQGVPVTQPTVLKVKAWKTGMTESAVQQGSYDITGDLGASGISLAVKADGSLWAWGNGYLGNGVSEQRTTPVAVTAMTDTYAVAVGSSHTVAIKGNGTAWAWGQNSSGQLGNGNTTTQANPVPVQGLVDQVVAVAAGNSHSLALTMPGGKVWAWGENGSGQVGNNSTTDQPSAVAVKLPSLAQLDGVVAIAAGADHSMALKSDGTVFVWGENSSHQIGNGSTTVDQKTALQLSGLTGVVAIGAAANTSYAIKGDGGASGVLYAWGSASDGLLANGTTTGDRISPEPVDTLPANVRSVRGRGAATYALDRGPDGRGNAWAWGGNAYGALGDGSETNRLEPNRNQLFPARAVVGGNGYGLGSRADATVWAWGLSSNGVLGVGSLSALSQPNPLQVSLNLSDPVWLQDDLDADGLSNGEELLAGTDPLDPDTDDDGLADGAAAENGLSPSDFDQDHDGLINALERAAGTDPFSADSDGDGVNDKDDAFPLDPTRSNPPSGTPGDTTAPGIMLSEPTSASLVNQTCSPNPCPP